MTKVAILIDGGFFSVALRHDLKLPAPPSAQELYYHAQQLAHNGTEEIWRIFYYDSHPSDGRAWHPITHELIELAKTPPAKARQRLLRQLGQMDLIALRCGQTRSRGWQLTPNYLRELSQGRLKFPAPEDYELRFEQKGVDMRIGIDVATLAMNHHVDRIIVVSNDTDLIPALNIARREGIQVVIVQVGSFNPHHDLVEDADFKRHYPLAA
jgi:uncharacterized LabA/DUF88 family protein